MHIYGIHVSCIMMAQHNIDIANLILTLNTDILLLLHVMVTFTSFSSLSGLDSDHDYWEQGLDCQERALPVCGVRLAVGGERVAMSTSTSRSASVQPAYRFRYQIKILTHETQ